MSEMEPNDYQLVRIGLLAAISDRAAELGQEIYEEADDTIDDLRTENDRLREQVAGLTAALIPFLRYADELLWGDRGEGVDDVVLRWPYYGPPRVIVRRSDFKSLRAAIPIPNTGLPISPVVPNTGLPISPVVPNTGLPISPVVPNPGLSISPAPPTEGGESS
jgi:hypothetical protein